VIIQGGKPPPDLDHSPTPVAVFLNAKPITFLQEVFYDRAHYLITSGTSIPGRILPAMRSEFLVLYE